MTNNTPGPWIVAISDDNQDLLVKAEHGGIIICDCNMYPAKDGTFDDEQEANARLIAAVPDLLEACEKLLGVAHDAKQGAYDIEQAGSAYHAALLAIAKAKGTT